MTSDDSSSDSSEEQAGVHLPAVRNPLSAERHTELLLRFPANHMDVLSSRDCYKAVVDFIKLSWKQLLETS